MSERTADQIIQECAGLAPQHSSGLGVASMAYEIALLRAELRWLYASMRPGPTPPGLHVAEMQLDNTKVWIEYEYEPGEEPSADVESRTCGPGTAPSLRIVAAFVNGNYIDPWGHIQAEVLGRWTQNQIENHQRDNL